jgi:ribosomal protein L20A (L18A)
MDVYLNNKGWGVGMMSLTYKEWINLEKIIYCISYKKAYEKVYYSIVKDHPLRDVDIKIKEFLDLIDNEVIKIMKSYDNVHMKNANDAINLLKTEGFIQL